MATKTVLAGVAIVSLCLSVRRKDLMRVVAGAMGADVAVVVALAFSYFAEFHSRPHKVLRAFKVSSSLQGKRLKESVGALQPIAFQNRRFYNVEWIRLWCSRY